MLDHVAISGGCTAGYTLHMHQYACLGYCVGTEGNYPSDIGVLCHSIVVICIKLHCFEVNKLSSSENMIDMFTKLVQLCSASSPPSNAKHFTF